MDVVDRFKLNTEVHTSFILHRKRTTDRARGLRRIEHVEKWSRVKEIGSGGFGVVFLEREEKGEVRAVKEIRKRFNHRQGQNFLRELLAMASFSSDQALFPHFQGWFEDSEKICIAMEYFPLGDLSRNITSPLPEEEAKSVGFQVAEALEVLHASHITHRDIKPENIFVCHAGPQWWIKLGDFGISKRVQDNETKLYTRYVGLYVAPEIYGPLDDGDDSEDCYTNAVDIWSLGCLLYWLLTAQPPLAVSKDVQRKGTATLVELGSGKIAQSGIKLIRECVSAQPKRRPSASEVLQSPWMSSLSDSVVINVQSPTSPTAAAPAAQADGPAATRFPVISSTGNSSLDSISVSNVSNVSNSDGSAVNTPQTSSEGSDVARAKSTPPKDSPQSTLSVEDATTSRRNSDPAPTASAVTEGSTSTSSSSKKKGRKSSAKSDKGDRSPGSSTGRRRKGKSKKKKEDDLFYKDSQGQGAMHFAAMQGQIAMVDHLRSLGQDIGARDSRGRTPLHNAAWKGHIDMVDHLLALGQDLDVVDDIDGAKLMHYAIRNGQIDMVKHIMKLGQDVSIRDSNLCGPVHYAAEYGQDNMLDYLLELGQELSPVDKFGRTPIYYAIQYGFLDTVNHILALGQEIEVTTKTGVTLQHYAAEYDQIEIVDRLIELGQDMLARDTYNRTPLCYAVQFGQLRMFNHLYELGEDIKVQSNNGTRLMHYAAEYGHINLVDRLVELGQDTRIKDERGRTPIHYAAQYGHIAMVDHLRKLGQEAENDDDSSDDGSEGSSSSGEEEGDDDDEDDDDDEKDNSDTNVTAGSTNDELESAELTDDASTISSLAAPVTPAADAANNSKAIVAPHGPSDLPKGLAQVERSVDVSLVT